MLKIVLQVLAVINLVLIPVWVIAFFGIASLVGNTGSWRELLFLIPAHIVLSIYALVHYRLFSENFARDAMATILMIEQIASLGLVAYGWSQV